MINISITRGKYIVTPSVPVTTESIDYTVSVGGQLDGSTTISASTVFVGKTRYFGGVYEVDCSDWIDTFITNHTVYSGSYHTVSSVTVTVVFTFTKDDNTTSTQTKTCTWTPEGINLPVPQFDSQCGCCQIELLNSGFCHYTSTGSTFKVKLLTQAGKLVGKTINNIEKTDYMDKYGDKHNGSATNKMEIECFVDPDWFRVDGHNMTLYNQLMTAMQCAKRSVLGPPSSSVVRIQGFSGSGGYADLVGRVKNVEKVEVSSIYSVDNKIPNIKITFEVYR